MCSHVKEVAVTVHILGEERNQKICFEACALCDPADGKCTVSLSDENNFHHFRNVMY